MNKNRNRLFVLLVCALVALVVFAACEPEVNTQTKKLDRIELDTTNTQTEFTVGDEFTYQGLEVRAFYDDNTSDIVTGYTVVANYLDDDGKLTVESNEATVSYTEEGVTKTATYDITVVAGTVETTKNVEGIKIIKQPNVTEYYVGETYSTEGLELEVTYDDETTEHITSGFAAPASTALAGEISVTVSYQGKTDTFTINVYNKLTGLKVEGANVYNIGDDFKGITVTALYNNKTTGGTVLDADDYTCEIAPELTDNKLDVAGTYTVTVNYNEEKIEGRPMNASDTFAITVLSPDDYALVYSNEADYVRNDDLVGKWVYYHNAEENGAELGSKANGAYANGTVTLNFTDNVDLWWCVQMFYKNPDFAEGSRYTVKMTLLANFSGSITVSGNVYALEANVAKPVEFTITQGSMATLSILLGMENGNVVAAQSGKLIISDIIFDEWNEPSTPGTGGGNTDPDDPTTIPTVDIIANPSHPNPIFIQIVVSVDDYNRYLSNATHIVIRRADGSSYTPSDWGGKGFEFLSTNHYGGAGYNIRLLESGTPDNEPYTIEWYNGDTLLATTTYAK